MKKQFANPELKIVMLDNADIIATSTGATGDDIPMSARFRDLEDED